jgi:hypothetical protein
MHVQKIQNVVYMKIFPYSNLLKDYLKCIFVIFMYALGVSELGIMRGER